MVVGEGLNPKLELLRWAKNRVAFSRNPVCADAPSFALSPGSIPTKLETHPRLVFFGGDDQNHRRFRVAPQLPRVAQPIIPLLYGTRKGFRFYAEFLFAWQERGNGEACQLGVSRASLATERPCSEEVQLKFSPSAGAVNKEQMAPSVRL